MAATFTVSADNREIIRALQQTQREVEKLKAKNKQLGTESRKTTASGKQGFKGMAGGIRATVSQLGLAVTGAQAFQMAVGQVRQAFAAMRKESEGALTSMRGLEGARRRLNQISTSAADLGKKESLADKMAATYGVSRTTARNVLFSAVSENFQKFYPTIMQAHQVVAPESAAQAAGQIPALFPGAGLTPGQSVNMVLAGAKKSRLNFEKLAATLPGAAEGANLAGATPEETMATAAVMASRFGSAETSARRLKVFGSKVGITPELKGKGFLGAMRYLQQNPQYRQKFLGESDELNVVYRTLTEEAGRIKKELPAIAEARRTAGTARSPLMRAVRIAHATPSFKATEKVAAAEAADEIATEQRLGVHQAEVQTFQHGLHATLNEYGAGRGQVLAAGKAAQLGSFLAEDWREILPSITSRSVETRALAAPAVWFGRFQQLIGILQKIQNNQEAAPRTAGAGTEW